MKKSLFFGMAALVAAGLTSCSNDQMMPEPSKPLDHDQSFFVNIDINSTDALTRAGDTPGALADYDPTQEPNFDRGTAAENQVKTIFLIFYDEDGNRVSTTQVLKNNLDSIGGRNPSEHSLYKGVVQIDVKHGSKKPTSVMCFINPISGQNFDINPEFETLDRLEHTTRPRIIADDNSFAMSKSMYYRQNGNKYEKVVATPIEQGQLFDKLSEAQDALAKDNDNNSPSMVDIYVERYAVKVNFDLANNASKVIDVDGQKLKFVPEYWAVNAYESNTYVTKSFYTNDFQTSLTYDYLNDIFKSSKTGKSWFWNSPSHHRCYWAQSPAYYEANYPRVADDILDQSELYAAGGYALGYYSYNEMKNNADGSLSAKARNLQKDGDRNAAIYARENTVSGDALIAAYENPLASPKAAMASVVLVGHYEVEGLGKLDDDEIFYVMGNAVNGYSYFREDDMLTYFVNTTLHFATNKSGTGSFFKYGVGGGEWTNKDYKKYFKIQHPDRFARNGLVIDSRFVTIQLDEKEITENTPLYAMLDGEWTQVTPDNIIDVNQQLLLQAGTAQGFLGGKAYYTIPIQHLGFYRDDNPNEGISANSKEFDWTGVKSGDFGLVRNHVYTIAVDKIEGLGNGIPDPEHPIVPPTDPNEYYIGARIVVLNWAVVPQQNVSL